MTSFSVPFRNSKSGGFFSFNVETGSVLFAGSRKKIIKSVANKEEKKYNKMACQKMPF